MKRTLYCSIGSSIHSSMARHPHSWLRMWRFAGLAVGAMPLAACMNLSGLDGSSQYGCQAPAGIKCESVSGTYYNSLKNNLPSQRAHGSVQAVPQSSSQLQTSRMPAYVPTSVPAVTEHFVSDRALPEPMPLRSQGKVLGLWFKPWKDADGDLFDEGHVYVQVDNGDWLIDHVQQRIRDAYAPVRPPAKAQQVARSPAVGTASSPPSSALAPGRSITDAAKALQAASQGEPGEGGDQ